MGSMGCNPTAAEINDSLEKVFKGVSLIDLLRNRLFSRNDAVEILFQIYAPEGTGLKNKRKSTWLCPVVNGQNVIQMADEIDPEQSLQNLGKCLEMVAVSLQNRKAIGLQADQAARVQKQNEENMEELREL